MITINRSDNPDTSLIRAWLRNTLMKDKAFVKWTILKILKIKL